MSHPETLPDLPNATSSPASADGRVLSDLQASLIAIQSGLAAALASLSPRQAKERGLLTSGTYGLTSTTSSASDDLEKSLVSRLREISSTHGSILYKLTWKVWAMPSGRQRSRLRGSVLRTSGTGPTGLAGWVTPTSRDWKDSGADIRPRSDTGKERYDQLPRQAVLAGWGTPTASDGLRVPAQDFATKNLTLNHGAGWPTPIANEAKADTARGTDLPTMASWTVTDGPARLMASGEMLTGSSAGTASGGLLHPAHSLWLMGYPIEWLSCGARAMQSMSTPRKRSSKRSTGAAE